MICQPVLSGERITLRPVRVEDAPFILSALSEPEITHWTGNQTSYTLEQVKAFCISIAQDSDRLDYAITQKEADEYIGEAVLQEIDWKNKHAHFRIAMASPEWIGRGFGREATLLLLTHGFEALGLHRIELEVYEFNHRARALYEKIGFVHEGVRRHVLLKDDGFHNALTMSLIATE